LAKKIIFEIDKFVEHIDYSQKIDKKTTNRNGWLQNNLSKMVFWSSYIRGQKDQRVRGREGGGGGTTNYFNKKDRNFLSQQHKFDNALHMQIRIIELYENEKYLNKFENIMNLLNHACFCKMNML